MRWNVVTFSALRPLLQKLCLHRWHWSMGGCIALCTGLSLAQVPAGENDSETGPWLRLQAAARAWLQTSGTPAAAAVQFAPLDKRLTVVDCTDGWLFDRPFAPQTTVRARCAQPSAQWFLQPMRSTGAALATVNLPPPDQPSATPPPTEDLPTVVTLRRSLSRGTRLTPEMVEMMPAASPRVAAQALDDAALVLHQELVRDGRAGEPLRPGDLRPATLVKRGQMVTLSLGVGRGFTITARLEALQDGRMGEQIRLKNRESGRVLSAVVTGDNTADAL